MQRRNAAVGARAEATAAAEQVRDRHAGLRAHPSAAVRERQRIQILDHGARPGHANLGPLAVGDPADRCQPLAGERTEIGDFRQRPLALVQDDEIDLRVMLHQIPRRTRRVVPAGHDPEIGPGSLHRARQRDELAHASLKAHRQADEVSSTDGAEHLVGVLRAVECRERHRVTRRTERRDEIADRQVLFEIWTDEQHVHDNLRKNDDALLELVDVGLHRGFGIRNPPARRLDFSNYGCAIQALLCGVRCQALDGPARRVAVSPNTLDSAS